MFGLTLNEWIAIAVATVLNQIIGFAIYGKLMVNSWIKAMNEDKGDSKWVQKQLGKGDGMGPKVALELVTAAVKFYFLTYYLKSVHAHSILDGALGGFWIAIGFLCTSQAAHSTWESRPQTLFVLFVVKEVAVMAAGGAALGYFL